MKKIVAVMIAGMLAFICDANEYTELLRKKMSIEKEISDMESRRESPWRWLFCSIRSNLNLDKDLKKQRIELSRIENRIWQIKNQTSVVITSIKLSNIPDFDRGKAGKSYADPRLSFRNRNRVFASGSCRDEVTFYISETIDESEVIVIYDYDFGEKDDDMGQIPCRGIFQAALGNDLSSGDISGNVYSTRGTYQYKIHYERR